MSVFIFYGQDNISLDNYFLEFRKNYTATETVQISTENLEDKIGSQGFFAEKKLHFHPQTTNDLEPAA